MKRSLHDKLVVILDGRQFLIKWRTVQTLEDLSEVSGDKWLITDFDGAVAKMMSVEAPQRYADMVARKRMMELGEMDDSAQVLTHWSKSRGRSTELLITPVAGEQWRPHEDLMREDEHQHMLFSHNALLHACLRHYAAKTKKNVVVLFEHGRHVDIVFGRVGSVLAAHRISSFGDDAEAKKALADQMKRELKSMADTLHVKLEHIVYFNWLIGNEDERTLQTAPSFATFGNKTEGGNTTQTKGTGWATKEGTGLGPEQSRLMSTEWIRTMARDLEADSDVLPTKLFDLTGSEFVATSLPQAVRLLTDKDASISTIRRVQYRSQRILPWITLATWAIIAGFYWAGLYFQRQANVMQGQIIKMDDLAIKDDDVPALKTGYRDVVDFADKLSTLKDTTSLRGLIAEISKARKGKMRLDVIEVSYDKNVKPIIKLTGVISSGFEQANLDHKSFLSILTSRGFKVLDNELKTNVKELRFTLKLTQEKT